MHFDFGQKRYVVSIVSRPLVLDGQPCNAKCDPAGLRILLSEQLASRDRRKKLFHELRHLWIKIYGPAQGEEADADDFANAMDDLMEQYLSQGGDAILENMIPDPETTVSKPPAMMLFVSRNCGFCQTRVAPGSIDTLSPEWNAEAGIWTIDRAISCDECGKLTTWRERCTPAGMPTGEILEHPKPEILEGRAAKAWRESHAAACG